MKKIALLMALLMLVLSLAACGGKNDLSHIGADDEGAEITDVVDEICEHLYNEEVLSEPSCTVNGMVQYTCSLCGEVRTDEISALGHDGSGASCDEASTCANCGEVVEAAWGHEDENGICKNCGISLEEPGSSEDAEATESTESVEAE